MNRREFLKGLVALSFLPSISTGLALAPLGLNVDTLEIEEDTERPAGAWQVGGSTFPVIGFGFEVVPEYVDVQDVFLSPVSRILVGQETTMTLELGGVYDLNHYRNITLPFLVWAESRFARSKDKLQIAFEARGVITNIDTRRPTAYEKKIVINGRKVTEVQEVDLLIIGDHRIYYKEIKNV